MRTFTSMTPFRHLHRSLGAVLSLGLLATTACATVTADPVEDSATATPASVPTVARPAPVQEQGPVPAIIALSRSLHEADMTEVVLDGQARSALTLDMLGGVRLWPDLQASQPAAPLALPVQEPVWMSLAQSADGGFVVGFIDTAGGARVARVQFDGDS
ncbi:MAG: hypothetical protein K0V04_23905, partial [Deltaproteobacteria bacterium]|nr:hypothetical protein [Deltaproteobacteria bacterium]